MSLREASTSRHTVYNIMLHSSLVYFLHCSMAERLMDCEKERLSDGGEEREKRREEETCASLLQLLIDLAS